MPSWQLFMKTWKGKYVQSDSEILINKEHVGLKPVKNQQRYLVRTQPRYTVKTQPRYTVKTQPCYTIIWKCQYHKSVHHIHSYPGRTSLWNENHSLLQTLKNIPWFKERPISEISLGGLLILVVIRTIQYNITRMRVRHLFSLVHTWL